MVGNIPGDGRRHQMVYTQAGRHAAAYVGGAVRLQRQAEQAHAASGNMQARQRIIRIKRHCSARRIGATSYCNNSNSNDVLRLSPAVKSGGLIGTGRGSRYNGS